MSDERNTRDHEEELIAELGIAASAALRCAGPENSSDSARWQLVTIAATLRDRMYGIRGGTVLISPKAFPSCIEQVKDVTEAANDIRNAPRYDAVVTEGKQAYETIDKSDTA